MRGLLLLPMCLGIAGCFPYDYTIRPGIAGTVIASDSHRPISGVSIIFGPSDGPTNAVGYTATDGSFSVPPMEQWGIWIIPQDVFTRPYPVSIRHDRYQPYETNILSNPAQRAKYATRQLGVVAVTPVSK